MQREREIIRKNDGLKPHCNQPFWRQGVRYFLDDGPKNPLTSYIFFKHKKQCDEMNIGPEKFLSLTLWDCLMLRSGLGILRTATNQLWPRKSFYLWQPCFLYLLANPPLWFAWESSSLFTFPCLPIPIRLSFCPFQNVPVLTIYEVLMTSKDIYEVQRCFLLSLPTITSCRPWAPFRSKEGH